LGRQEERLLNRDILDRVGSGAKGLPGRGQAELDIRGGGHDDRTLHLVIDQILGRRRTQWRFVDPSFAGQADARAQQRMHGFADWAGAAAASDRG
jgi:hypothetical protein